MLVRSLVIPLPFLIVPTGSNPSLSLEEGIVIHLIGQTFSVDTRSGSTVSSQVLSFLVSNKSCTIQHDSKYPIPDLVTFQSCILVFWVNNRHRQTWRLFFRPAGDYLCGTVGLGQYAEAPHLYSNWLL